MRRPPGAGITEGEIGVEPEAGHAQASEVVKSGGQAWNVAHCVAVAILERLAVERVDDCMLEPPLVHGGITSSSEAGATNSRDRTRA